METEGKTWVDVMAAIKVEAESGKCPQGLMQHPCPPMHVTVAPAWGAPSAG
jgi:hypothetical protein